MRLETRPGRRPARPARQPGQLLGGRAGRRVGREPDRGAADDVLRAYVRDLGRGLLAIGGDTSFGQGDYIGTPLDDALPVRSSVRSHRDQGRVALLLVIDHLGLDGRRRLPRGHDQAGHGRQAAILSTQQLAPRDQVGILTFDSVQHWILPLTSVLGMRPTLIQDRLAPLAADGGTDIFPALSHGLRRHQRLGRALQAHHPDDRRHVVLRRRLLRACWTACAPPTSPCRRSPSAATPTSSCSRSSPARATAATTSPSTPATSRG